MEQPSKSPTQWNSHQKVHYNGTTIKKSDTIYIYGTAIKKSDTQVCNLLKQEKNIKILKFKILKHFIGLMFKQTHLKLDFISQNCINAFYCVMNAIITDS